MVINMIAILKTGAAYVPIDPDFPEERINYLIKNTKVLLTLTEPALLHKLISMQNEDSKNTFLAINTSENQKLISQYSDRNLNNPLLTDKNLAYVIYTSGTTGVPKGVLIEHQSTVNCIYAMKDSIKVNSNDKFLAMISIVFDVSVLDYFLPLVIGAQIIIADNNARQAGEIIANLIKEYQITAMQASPSVWSMLLNFSNWPFNKTNFKMLSAGEILSPGLAKKLCHLVPYIIFMGLQKQLFMQHCRKCN